MAGCVNYKELYDRLHQKEYEELYNIVEEFDGYVQLIDDNGNPILKDEDIPAIALMLEGSYYHQDAKVISVKIGLDDKLELKVLPQDCSEEYDVCNIKRHVAYHQLYYITEYLVNYINSKYDTNRDLYWINAR